MEYNLTVQLAMNICVGTNYDGYAKRLFKSGV